MYLKQILFLSTCLFLLTACMGKNNNYSLEPPDDQPLELTKLSTGGLTDQQPANQAKQEISKHDAIEGVRAVNDGDQLLIGVKLRHHDRINMDDIKKELRKKVKKNFSDMTVTLSTDKKIHLELQKLEQDMQAGDISKEEFKKRLNQIKALSKEET